ncbi:GTP-binding protein [Trichothermofontia sichuanensis B231]|uniref:GTP-binding protein n=1 Tax=Trichothermofontia sichuanensis TaxID=3045816 RepID=UPI002247FD46|nr:GTP-binding protein [Trichothermofontia sichuanensis]UZQ54894.1 GTP-binding protein [Trichothermofontia sichuanensis B231]
MSQWECCYRLSELTLTEPSVTAPSAPAAPAAYPQRQSPVQRLGERARMSVRRLITRCQQRLRTDDLPATEAEVTRFTQTLQQAIAHLTTVNEHLEQQRVRIAAFGLVSRGKSAVLNALVGEKRLPTGPLNGVTQEPQSLFWHLPVTEAHPWPSVIELIDTPGLDEIEGQARAEMAQRVAQQADLILFVVAGDITRTEYQALLELRQAHKPLLLVFNKIDLYPDADRASIYQKLQTLGQSVAPDAQPDAPPSTPTAGSPNSLFPLLTPDEIVLVMADPVPLPMRIEWQNQAVTYTWDQPQPNVEPLRQKILQILQREGMALLAVNALQQARRTEQTIARTTLTAYQDRAEQLVWNYAKYKAIAVALNPIGLLDVFGGSLIDLLLIRALARLYGLPITGHEAGKVCQTLGLSAGGLLLAEVASSTVLGLGKSALSLGAAGLGDVATGLFSYLSLGAGQGAMAGYGTYLVGRATQVYLEQGCTWEPLGPDRVLREILAQVDRQTVLDRLRQELTL